jgi:glycosyltransferase involved in cell wall biosynthesis
LFAVNGQGVAWSLADEYDVHILGLQSTSKNNAKIHMAGETREVTQHPNLPRGKNKWDFGHKSLPRLLNELNPDILLTINDIQMIQHVPSVLYPTDIKMKVMDMPSKKMISEDAMVMNLKSQIQRFKEKYPPDIRWILLGPQDGDPPMPQWSNIYNSADRVVSMSDYGKRVYKQFYNIDSTRIYHSVDTHLFNPKDRVHFKDKFVVGNFNRNQPRKFPIRTMRAFAKFAKDKDDVLLHMQMDWDDVFGWPLKYFGPMFGIINKMIRPAPVGISREQVAGMYSQWDVNVNSTGGEGFGLTTIEGSACGIPNIITDYTTSKELVIDGKPSPRGKLVKPIDLYWEKMDVAAVRRSLIDVDGMAEAMQFYYDNPDVREQHGKNGVEWVKKNCDIKVIEKEWKKLIKEELNEK